jgi:hypothetical protein
MGSDSDERIPEINLADISCTILARDYKGLSNYGSNGVIEVYADNCSDERKES